MKKLLLILITIYSTSAIFAQHKPTAQNVTKSVKEDETLLFSENDFGYSDADEDNFKKLRILSKSGGGVLKYGNTVITNSEEVKILYISYLKYKPAPNENGNGYFSFTFKVQDSDGDVSEDEKTMKINVISVNDPPSFQVQSPLNIQEDAGQTERNNWAYNISPGPNEDETVSFSCSSSNPNLFSQLYVNNSGKLVCKPKPNAYGNATITITASDGSATSQKQFAINVNPVNDTPDFQMKGNQTVQEDCGMKVVPSFVYNTSTGAPNESQSLKFTTTNNNNALFDVQPTIDNSNRLKYKPAPNQSGVATVDVKLSETSGSDRKHKIKSFTITVQEQNDLPTSSDQAITFPENTVCVIGTGNFVYNDIDNDAFNHIKCLSVPQKGKVWVDSNGNDEVDGGEQVASVGSKVSYSNLQRLKYKPEEDNNGTQKLQFQVNDGKNYSTDVYTIKFTITPVNSEPFFKLKNNPNVTVQEDHGAYSMPNFATDITAGGIDEEPGGANAQQVKFTLNISGDQSIFSVLPEISESGTLTFQTAPNKHGEVTVTARISDQVNPYPLTYTCPNTFKITVERTNDAPTFDVAFSEKEFFSVPANKTFSFDWASNPSPGEDEDENVAYQIKVESDPNSVLNGAPTINSNGRITVGIRAKEDGIVKLSVVLKETQVSDPTPETSAKKYLTIKVKKSTFLNEHNKISEAIQNTNEGGRIYLEAGTYEENVVLNNKSVEIIGDINNPDNVKIIGKSGNPAPIITFENGNSTTLRGVTISGGKGTGSQSKLGGGVYAINANPTITDAVISGNKIEQVELRGASGGGIYLQGCSNATLTNVKIIKNEAEIYRGGGIAMLNSHLVMNKVFISENKTGNYGGGIFAINSTLNMKDVTIRNNEAMGPNGTGGGLFMIKCQVDKFENIIIESNNTSRSKGKNIRTYGTATLSGSLSGYDHDW